MNFSFGRLVSTAALLTVTFGAATGQQNTGQRVVRIAVTDPLNRFVTGLDQDRFHVVENGTPRSIASFASAEEPIAIAVVSESPVDLNGLTGPGELIQTRSVADALRQLQASSRARKALIIASGEQAAAVPAGVDVVRSDVNGARKWIVELRNEYTAAFASARPDSTIEVVLDAPRGMPALKGSVRP